LLPLSANLFEQLKDSAKGSTPPYLSAARLSPSRTNLSVLNPAHRSIRCGPRKLFRAAPAFLWRVRFLTSPRLTEKDTLIATFDIETTAFASSNVQLTNVDLNLTSGSYDAVGVKLPIVSQPGEQVALIYKIFPSKDGTTEVNSDGASNRTLTVTVTAIVMVSKTCLPTVKIKWKTILELPPSRPPSRALPSPMHPEPLSMLAHDALLMTGQVAEVRSLSGVADGVSLAITAPSTVYVGKRFRWEILVVNRSAQVYHLAIIALSKKRNPNLLSAIPRPRSRGNQQTAQDSLAAPLIDDNVLYSIHKNTILEPTDLVCLTPDVKLG
jgi:hypothetical protein